MISNKTIKREQPIIDFYCKDIITYIKKQNSILDLQNNSRKSYKQILPNKYGQYLIIGQSIWDQYSPQNQWNQLWNNRFYSYSWLENNNILEMILHHTTVTNDHIRRWTNQKHLISPNCKLCDQIENINHLYVHCKRNKEIW